MRSQSRFGPVGTLYALRLILLASSAALSIGSMPARAGITGDFVPATCEATASGSCSYGVSAEYGGNPLVNWITGSANSNVTPPDAYVTELFVVGGADGSVTGIVPVSWDFTPDGDVEGYTVTFTVTDTNKNNYTYSMTSNSATSGQEIKGTGEINFGTAVVDLYSFDMGVEVSCDPNVGCSSNVASLDLNPILPVPVPEPATLTFFPAAGAVLYLLLKFCRCSAARCLVADRDQRGHEAERGCQT